MLRQAPRRVGLLKSQQRRQFSQHQQQKQHYDNGAAWKIPATMGFALIGFLQWQHLNTDGQERKTHRRSVTRLPGTHTAFEDTMATERQLQSLKLFPYRAASRLWGEAVVDARTRLQGVDRRLQLQTGRDEVSAARYANLGEFFSRPLKEGVRPFDTVPGHLASPVDGTVASIGQIKGARYRLDEFLGNLPSFFTKETSASKGKKMFHCVLYLAPGDYHRIHAPVDWQVEERRHFPGNLFPVNQTAARLIPSLFVENERVALLGEWEHGFFSLTAVGATNVGSIVITKEPEFRTNTVAQDPLNYGDKVDTTRGEEMAQFKLGSTVVLVFEAPESFQFTIKPGDKHGY
ncbi:Phosphatidylserine decarboxylase [Phytophthora cactorum]|nr:Phosphatidylserine decarboxylase [Phytophthora cactorum]